MAHRSDDDPDDTDEYRNWAHNLDRLQEIGEELLDEWRNQKPNSPRDYPAVRWLNDNGYSHLRWVLREKHDMGTREFFVLLTSAGGTDGYDWALENVATIGIVRNYLDDRVECRDWADSTKRTNRARINEVLRRFSEKYGDAAIVSHANDRARQTELYSTFKQIVKELRKDLSTHDSALHYLRAAHRLFEWLERSNRIEYDPMAGLEAEFTWDLDADPTPLTDEQVTRLWVTAETAEERLLVVGYCVWGVRTSELPAIHVDQLQLDTRDPKISFEDRDRKNGQGEVSLLFGLAALATVLDKRARQPEWDGHLFPSADSGRAFLTGRAARSKFKALCQRADVTIDGDVATPKHGRSFYYNVMADAETDLLEMASKIADEQGAKDPSSVRDYYLTPDRRRRYRRIFFRRRIREILPEDAYAAGSDSIGFDTTLDDFE